MTESTGKGVSVITPAYNAAKELHRAIRSVAAQTFPILEHIVVDDGSRDDTRALLESLSRQVPNLVVIHQPHLGAAAARNRGIEAARGRYIAFLDSDDEWLPEKLATQIGFMRETGTLFSYGDYLRCHYESRLTLGAVQTPDCLGHADFLRGCPIGCLTVVYDQEQLGKCYMPPIVRGHDWGLWLSLTRRGVVGRRYPGVEAIYSVRPGSLSAAKLRKAQDIYTIYRTEERLGWLESMRLLLIHSLNSFRAYRRPRFQDSGSTR